jgi:hypothetical protein
MKRKQLALPGTLARQRLPQEKQKARKHENNKAIYLRG